MKYSSEGNASSATLYKMICFSFRGGPSSGAKLQVEKRKNCYQRRFLSLAGRREDSKGIFLKISKTDLDSRTQI